MPENKSARTSADNARSEEKVIYERSSTDNKRDRSNNEACRPEKKKKSSVGTPSHFPVEFTTTSGSAVYRSRRESYWPHKTLLV